MELYTAPDKIPLGLDVSLVSIFLAGSIEQGKAKDWQSAVTDAVRSLPVIIFNPRRKEWDASLKQDISNPVFVEQVNWELDQIKRAQIMFFYFQTETLAPISLMELGIAATEYMLDPDVLSSVVVVCEPGYWRRGNVQILCDRATIPVYDALEDGVDALIGEINFWGEL